MGFISIIIGYLLGSLSGAIILSKIKKLPDPRTTGSGNAGATNMLRSTGLNNAAIVMIVDIVKGLVAIIIARILGASAGVLSLVALATVLGHIYPVFFKFKGGKGVATMLGCLIGLAPLTGILCFVIWGAVLYLTKYASLASIATACSSVVLTFLFGDTVHTFSLLIITMLIIYTHKENLLRLKNGTENKVEF